MELRRHPEKKTVMKDKVNVDKKTGKSTTVQVETEVENVVVDYERMNFDVREHVRVTEASRRTGGRSVLRSKCWGKRVGHVQTNAWPVGGGLSLSYGDNPYADIRRAASMKQDYVDSRLEARYYCVEDVVHICGCVLPLRRRVVCTCDLLVNLIRAKGRQLLTIPDCVALLDRHENFSNIGDDKLNALKEGSAVIGMLSTQLSN
jgi:hypothetical protein